jgi:hypothetical protein
MKILAPLFCALLLATPALAGRTAPSSVKPQKISGNGALALAALVGEQAPLPANEKAVLAAFLDGNPNVAGHAGAKIQVTADSVSCRASDVDLTLHSCDLVFGKKKASLSGRSAHELYATLIEAGVPSDGAAGSIYESVAKLACTVDPKEVASEAGGGAECTFTAGVP